MTSKEMVLQYLKNFKVGGRNFGKTFEHKMFNEVLKDLDRLEVLEKENQDLKLKYESHDFLYQNEVSKNGVLAGKIFEKDLKIQKLKKLIKFLGEQLDLDVDLENHNLITDEGTIGFVNDGGETMSILELLREVLEE